ncbi:MAG TPA: dihydrofolate reductase family protein [Tepidiformaceae bacterium]|nr:dihydrofolate reductase family protein [Tepidiformaceae bacterium]
MTQPPSSQPSNPDPNKPDYTALDFPEPPPNRPYIIVNMVMSADGKAVIEGNEQGLGSKVDQRLMRELRVNADVVLNGASTLRISGTSSRLSDAALEQIRLDRGKPRFPIAAVWSRSGDLPLDKIFFTARDFEAVVYLSDSAPRNRREAAEATGRPIFSVPAVDDLGWMLAHMRHELGARVLLCEGGPTTTAQFFGEHVVDEYFTTIGPEIVAGRDTLTPVEGPVTFSRDSVRHLDLVSMTRNHETSELYLRYRVRH